MFRSKQWNKIILCLLFCFPYLQAVVHAEEVKEQQITLTVKSSSEATFHTSLQIESERWLDMLTSSDHQTVQHSIPSSDITLVQSIGGREIDYTVDTHGNLYHNEQMTKLLIPLTFQKQLKELVKSLREKHYGELLTWEEASKIIPRKSKFEIIDLETGMRFNVQRRAGSTHADVQPLSRKDTKIMKEVYEGKWSWKRRAILIHKDGRYIAASMHGMPHGRGALQNGFPGHFCVHFYKSITHRTKNEDPPHQAMIHKAAGQLDQYLEHISPHDLVNVLFMAMIQHDKDLIKRLVIYQSEETLSAFLEKVDNVNWIASTIQSEDESNGQMFMKFDVKAKLTLNSGGTQNTSFSVIVRRNSFAERWMVDLDSIGSIGMF